MARINLLPWREELRKERMTRFYTMLGVATVCIAVIIGLVHYHFVERISYQSARNQYIEQQNALLDKKIKRIKEIEKEKEKLLSRMRAIEQLQTSRPVIVHLFDELVSTLPEGVFLESISQKADKITVKGVARSNARVSNFMRNVESSEWVTSPTLDIIETRSADGRRLSKFTLRLQQVQIKSPEDEESKS